MPSLFDARTPARASLMLLFAPIAAGKMAPYYAAARATERRQHALRCAIFIIAILFSAAAIAFAATLFAILFFRFRHFISFDFLHPFIFRCRHFDDFHFRLLLSFHYFAFTLRCLPLMLMPPAPMR
jgi:hypothetical protein